MTGEHTGAGEPSSNPLRGLAELAFGSLTRADLPASSRVAFHPSPGCPGIDLADPVQREFGDYELLEKIGEGGMGIVYRARHRPLDRMVAVKLLTAGVWASADFVARFGLEARNAARMQHPNIVTVFETGNRDGLHFLAMRLVEGQSLAAWLNGGKCYSPKQAAILLRTVTEAVAYAHSLGVLHLDLKPGNVLIDTDGAPHVADFGLARRLDSALATDNDEVSGTPSYMAPEQARVRSQKLTAATDVWGLGAILYELLTGQPPFRAESAQATLKLVLEGRVRAPRRWRPELPLDLQAIVLKCLEKNRERRYPSARALADDLTRFIEGRPVLARPLNAAQRAWRWAKREPRFAGTALLAFVVLAGGLLATAQQWRRADASAHVARENLWATRAQTAQQALAKGDGFHGLRPLVANVVEMEAVGRSDESAVERERIGTILANAPQLIDLVHLPGGEVGTSLAVSPDGRHVAVATIERDWGGARRVRQYELATLRETWSATTDARTFLMVGGDHGAPHGGLRYTADGRVLLVSMVEQPVIPAPRRSDMIAIDARDGRVLVPAGLPHRQADIVYDDGARLALVRYRSHKSWRWPDSGRFYEVDGWRPVGPLHTSATTLAADLWLPAPDGGAWLGTRDSANIGLYAVPSLKALWRVHLPQTSLVRAWSFSHDGRLVALGSVDGAVRLVDAANGRVRQFTAAPAARVQSVEFSADGGTLAAIDENGQFWTWDVATGAARSAPMQLLRSGTAVAQIRYNGDMVFGGGLHDSDAELAYVMLAPRAVLNNEAVPGTARLPSPAPLGNAFDVSVAARRLVTASSSGLVEVWRLPVSPLRAAHAAPMPAQRLTFDGQRIVAVDGDAVRVVDAADGAALSPSLRHPEPVRFAELSPDGHALVTIAGRTVRVIDPVDWKLRGGPIVLPQTPERAVFASAAPLLVLTTAEYAGDVRRERIHRIDLAHGTLLDTHAQLDAVTRIEVDPRGRHALVMTLNTASRDEAGPLYVALDDGRVACRPALVGVRNFAFAPDGRTAWIDVARNGQSSLRRWNLAVCQERAAYDRGQRETVTPALLVRGDGGVVAHHAGNQALLRVDRGGRRETALGEAIPDSIHDFALSDDGTRAAFASRNAAYLIDAVQGRRLSTPLLAPITGDDAIIALAFSPDGRRLLARTVNGRWLVWDLPPAALDVTSLARLARVLDPVPADALSAADLAALRAGMRDSAPATPVTARVTVTAARRTFAPAAGAGSDARFVPLDLRPAVNLPLVGVVWPEPAARGDRPTLAPGLQRFLGVDYRVDGGVQLVGGGTATALGPELHRSATIAVSNVVATRVHVLAFMHIPMNASEPSRPFADVVLTGADRRETRLPVRTVRDVATDLDSDGAARSARVAYVGISSALARRGIPVQPQSDVYTVGLDVPSGTGPIRGLRFEVPDGPMEAPLFYAATLEVLPRAAAHRSD